MSNTRFTLTSMLVMLAAGILWVGVAAADDDLGTRAIEVSQAARGNTVNDMELIDVRGQTHRLQDFFGKPLVISLIYTSCSHSCSTTTHHINRVVQVTRDALGDESFTFLSIGFNYPADTPEAMAHYARRHGVTDPNWHFMSSRKPEELKQLMQDLGFIYQPSPRGLDHTVQVTVIDQDARVYRQVYGETFSTPLLVEPMKDLVLGRPQPDDSALTVLSNRVRLFCTSYDPKADRYYFDYSLFVGIAIGIIVLGTTMVWMGVELFRRRRGQAV